MPDRSGYVPLANHDDEEQTVPRHRPRGRRRMGSVSVDLTSIDNAFKLWTNAITSKFSSKPKQAGPSKKQILRSVFEPVGTPLVVSNPKTLDHRPAMTRDEFNSLTDSIRSAIAEGIHPKMIIKGSSGSYFARAKSNEGKIKVLAIFKPANEEPYGSLNPKTTKWIHRQLRFVIPFGRACLIPGLSYISEGTNVEALRRIAKLYLVAAAASLLDIRLQLHIVPPTHLVSLSSPAFFYDWIDRNAARNGKPLPEKIGSMQFFLSGYTDASEFLRKHPLPGRAIVDTFNDSTHRHGSISRRVISTLNVVCGKTGDADDEFDEFDYEEERVLYDATETTASRPFLWTSGLQESFREELEKLVILDYLMLNTDRGADNYMIKYCDGEHEKLVDVAPTQSTLPSLSSFSSTPAMGPSLSTASFHDEDYTRKPHIHVAAIDNSLAFPHEHPKGWRTYTYGWLYLPVSVIGRPFSDKTRNHFLPMLTSKEWWEDTTYELEKLFRVDSGFHPNMFARQMAVMKGQAWNIVQSLLHADEGPLELTRRGKMLVFDEEASVEDVEEEEEPVVSSRMSVASGPLPRRARSHSRSADFPPPLNRVSTDRPVPFAAKFKRVHPGTKGIDVLEHLERLDAVEASLQRLGVESDVDDEVDVGESSFSAQQQSAVPASPLLPPLSPPLETVPESVNSSDAEEEDVAMLSKSVSYVQSGPKHTRWISHATAPPTPFIASTDPTRIPVVERLESVTSSPMCSCW
uniref:Phosphatidylinositol 4-kinase n=1 Tax=Mycena chlorophos TaxID=658473 RepID=A0ABQ0LZ80_MYCCL|nr:predicted protein [Mycena chlorophos]